MHQNWHWKIRIFVFLVIRVFWELVVNLQLKYVKLNKILNVWFDIIIHRVNTILGTKLFGSRTKIVISIHWMVISYDSLCIKGEFFLTTNNMAVQCYLRYMWYCPLSDHSVTCRDGRVFPRPFQMGGQNLYFWPPICFH